MKTCISCSNTFDDSVSFCPHDGEVLQEAPESLVGQIIDGLYEVESFIAQGGMGAVYRARHILLGDRVVIKTLRPEMRGNAEWLRRFKREGQAARKFRHPNAVAVHDLRAAPDGLIYLVMEYVEGRTLDRELRERGRFTPLEALQVLEPVADVLDAAHSVGVVHRDLKPENVMVGPADKSGRPMVKLLDLGISKMLGDAEGGAGAATSLTVAGQLIGTPHYMSPEQWGELPRDGGSEVDGRTDIYSLGLIFHELVSGSKPFDGRTFAEVRRMHVSAPVPALKESASDVPEAFAHAVARSLAKDRNDRPSTAGEMIAEMRAALGLPAHVHTTHAPAAERKSTTQPHAEDTPGRQTFEMTTPTPTISEVSGQLETMLDAGGATSSPLSHETSANEPARFDPLRTVAIQAPKGGTSQAPSTEDLSKSGAQQHTHPSPLQQQHAPQQQPPAPQQQQHTPQQQHAQHSTPATVFQQPQGHAPNFQAAVQAPTATAPSRGRGKIIVAVAAVIALIVVGVSGIGLWYLLSRPTQGPAAKSTGETTRPTDAGPQVPPADASVTPGADAPATGTELVRYWVMAYTNSKGKRMAAEPLALTSGQQFQLHLVPRVEGYLYIFAQETGGPVIALLTSKSPRPMRNELRAGAEFTFPPGDNVLELDRKKGTEVLTVIFSPTPLAEPSALSAEPGDELTADEQFALEEFAGTHFMTNIAISGGESNGDEHVAISGTEGKPLAFRIFIEHN